MNYRDVVLFILDKYNTENPDSMVMLHTNITVNSSDSYTYSVSMRSRRASVDVDNTMKTSSKSVAEQEAFKLILNQIIDYDRF